MRWFSLPLICCFALLAACSGGGLGGQSVSRNVIPGVNPNAHGVDGLLVGHRLMESGEYDLALKAYMRGAAEHGMTVDALSAIGSANLALGRLGQAENILRRATELDPTFVPAVNNLGVVLMERGKVSEARVVFQRAFQLDSGETDSIRENLNRAIAAMEKPKYEEEDGPVLYELMRRGDEGVETLNSL